MSGYEIGRVAVGDLSTNCYVVKNKETGDACVIDPGDNLTLIQDLLHRMDAKCRLILLTCAVTALPFAFTNRTHICSHSGICSPT